MTSVRRSLTAIAALLLFAASSGAQRSSLDFVEQPPRSCCTALTVSDDGGVVAAAWQGQVTLWDLATGLEVRTLIPVERASVPNPSMGRDFGGLAFDASNRYIASTPIDLQAWRTLGRLGRVTPPNIWELPSGSDVSDVEWRNTAAFWQASKDPVTIARLAAYSGDVNVFGPDGKVGLVVTSPGAPNDSAPYDVKAVDLISGSALWTWRITERTEPVFTFSPDGRWILITGWTAPRVLDARSGKEVNIGALADVKNIRDVAFSRDSSHLALVGPYYAIVFTVGDWRQAGLSTFETSDLPTVVTFMPDETQLAIGSSEAIVVRDWQHGRQIKRIDTNGAQTFTAVTASSGRWLGSGTAADNDNWDGDVILWDMSGLAPPQWLWGESSNTIRSIAFSADDRRIATASAGIFQGNRESQPQGNISTCLLDACDDRSTLLDSFKNTGGQASVFPEAAGAAVGFARDGATLVAGVIGTVASEPYPKLVFYDLATLQPRRVTIAGGHVFSALAISPDGTSVATGHDQDTARLWGWPGGRQQRYFLPQRPADEPWSSERTVNSVAFAPDGKTLATAGTGALVRLWDVATGASRRVGTSGPTSLAAVTFSPDGTQIITGECVEPAWPPPTVPVTIKAWSSVSLEPAWSVHTTSVCVSALSFGPGGKWFAAATKTGIGIHAASNGALLMTMATLSSGEWLAWTPDGRYAGSPVGIADLVAVRDGLRAVPLSSIGQPMLLADLFAAVLK